MKLSALTFPLPGEPKAGQSHSKLKTCSFILFISFATLNCKVLLTFSSTSLPPLRFDSTSYPSFGSASPQSPRCRLELYHQTPLHFSPDSATRNCCLYCQASSTTSITSISISGYCGYPTAGYSGFKLMTIHPLSTHQFDLLYSVALRSAYTRQHGLLSQ